MFLCKVTPGTYVLYSASAQLAMQTAVYATSESVHPSVRLSVCLSICPPSHSGVLSRRMKLRSCGFHRQVRQSLHTASRSQSQQGQGQGQGQLARPAVCIYLEWLCTRLRPKLAVCIASAYKHNDRRLLSPHRGASCSKLRTVAPIVPFLFSSNVNIS